MSLWVKICANTTAEDALLAVEYGADAVGFVFAPSRRQVTAAQVAGITPKLPAGVERVGVFAGWPAAQIAGAVEQAGLSTVQLHDGWSEPFAAELELALGREFPMLWTVPWQIGVGPEAQAQVARGLDEIATHAPHQRVLLDAKVGAASGGLGVSFDWNEAGAMIASRPGLRVVVAGGLKPENLPEAIRKTRPYGVDVASGVEAVPGRKDANRLRAFLRAARSGSA